MANYTTLAELFNTSSNLTVVVDNTRHDDDTVTITGISWFLYGNVACETFYVNGNGWIGFGASREDLKVNRRDQAMWNLWYETGLVHSQKFFRIKWDGFSVYNQTADAYKLTYEVVFLDTQDIYLNIITYPTSSNTGTNSLLLADNTEVSFTPATSHQWTFIHQDNQGNVYTAQDHIDEIAIIKYLFSDDTDAIYNYVNDTFVDLDLSEQNLTSADFTTYGNDDIPTDILTLTNPKIYKWMDNDYDSLTAILSAVPYPQAVISEAISLTGMLGIENVIATCEGNPVFAVSVDDGTTWKMWNSVQSRWDTVSQINAGMTATELNSVTTSNWNTLIAGATSIKIRFTLLVVTDKVTNVILNYILS